MTKYTVTLSDGVADVFDSLAEDKGRPRSEILRRALAVYDYLSREKATISLTYPDGHVVQLVLEALL